MRILLIEDNRELCASLSFQLENAGCQTDVCSDGADAFYYLGQHIYDRILLGQLPPHLDRQTFLRKLRTDKGTTPVISLTTADKSNDKANGPEAAADNDPGKPCTFEELWNRIHSSYRRPVSCQQKEVLHFKDISYCSANYLLTGPTGRCTLSKKEGSLLYLFLSNPSQTLPRLTLISKVWGPDAKVEEGNLDNYMYLVRRRLKSVGSDTKIHTIRGIGYQLEDAFV